MFWQCTSLQTKDLLKLKFILCSAICVGQPKQTMRSLGLGTKSTRLWIMFWHTWRCCYKVAWSFPRYLLKSCPIENGQWFHVYKYWCVVSNTCRLQIVPIPLQKTFCFAASNMARIRQVRNSQGFQVCPSLKQWSLAWKPNMKMSWCLLKTASGFIFTVFSHLKAMSPCSG